MQIAFKFCALNEADSFIVSLTFFLVEFPKLKKNAKFSFRGSASMKNTVFNGWFVDEIWTCNESSKFENTNQGNDGVNIFKPKKLSVLISKLNWFLFAISMNFIIVTNKSERLRRWNLNWLIKSMRYSSAVVHYLVEYRYRFHCHSKKYQINWYQVWNSCHFERVYLFLCYSILMQLNWIGL